MEIGKISIEGNIYNCIIIYSCMYGENNRMISTSIVYVNHSIMEVRESIVDGKGNTSLLLVKYCEIPDYDKILERIE